MPVACSWVNTYTDPSPAGTTRENADTRTPGTGSMWKSTAPHLSSASTRIGMSPALVCTIHRPFSRRTPWAKPTAQRGRFAGSATNACTAAGGPSIMMLWVSLRITPPDLGSHCCQIFRLARPSSVTARRQEFWRPCSEAVPEDWLVDAPDRSERIPPDLLDPSGRTRRRAATPAGSPHQHWDSRPAAGCSIAPREEWAGPPALTAGRSTTYIRATGA